MSELIDWENNYIPPTYLYSNYVLEGFSESWGFVDFSLILFQKVKYYKVLRVYDTLL